MRPDPKSKCATSSLEGLLTRALVGWVAAVCRRPRAVAALVLIASLPLALYTLRNLGIDSDNTRMVGPDLEFRRNHDAFEKRFPGLDEALLVVIDAETPELARTATAGMLAALRARPERFTDVYEPAGGAFFERNGLLYRSLDELDEFADQMARVQPIVAALERDPSIGNLASLIRRGLDFMGESADGPDAEGWAAVLRSIGRASVAVYEEFPVAVSWENTMLRGSGLPVATRRVVVAHPVLDFEDILAARQAMHAIREAAGELGLSPASGVNVRVTGNPALNYEEMNALAWDIGGAGLFCFLLVAAILRRALGSLRMVAAALATLGVGLVWTAAFAAAAIGHLNLVSTTFAILFIGLGVDFCIHLGMRYADELANGAPETAMVRAVDEVGGSLAICAVTTAIGFFVFIPTQYLGVAELGAIAGVGMFAILFLTLTLFPALLSSWLSLDAEALGRAALVRPQPDTNWRRGWRAIDRHPAAVRWGALAFGFGALLLLPRTRFDPNVIAMRDPTTVSVQAFDDLLEQSGVLSPWFLNAMAKDLDAARSLAQRLRGLEVVDTALTLADYVPEDQQEKLEILEDIAFLMDAAPAKADAAASDLSVEEQLAALSELRGFLERSSLARVESPLGESMRELDRALQRLLRRVEVEGEAAQAMRQLEQLLLSGLPDQLARLRRALAAQPIQLSDLPERLVGRLLSPDGVARVQIFPRETLSDAAAFERFADGVRQIAPRATGPAVNLIEFGRAIQAAFRQALASAVLVIAALLFLLWRNAADTALALAPLLLAALLTSACMVISDIPFNFANVIVIPLLLGIGIDSGIHMVHRAKRESTTSATLRGSTTARAVFYSAVTTLVSFGSLGFSSHRGMQSLGLLLCFGMVLTVISNLVVLPALLELRRSRG